MNVDDCRERGDQTEKNSRFFENENDIIIYRSLPEGTRNQSKFHITFPGKPYKRDQMSLAILSPGRLCIQYLPASDTEDSPHPREFHLDFSLPNDKSNVEQIGDNL